MKKTSPTGTVILQFSLEELILNLDHPEGFLQKHMEKFHLNPTQTWQILCIKFTNYLQFRTTYHYEIMNQIKQIVSGSHCALINSNIAVLIDGSVDLSSYLNMLQYLLVTNDAICVCSFLTCISARPGRYGISCIYSGQGTAQKRIGNPFFTKTIISNTVFPFYIMNFRNRHCIILHFTKFRNLICKPYRLSADADLLSAK